MSLINLTARIIEDAAKAGICMADPSAHDCESIVLDE
jgi:hypothetical protein